MKLKLKAKKLYAKGIQKITKNENLQILLRSDKPLYIDFAYRLAKRMVSALRRIRRFDEWAWLRGDEKGFYVWLDGTISFEGYCCTILINPQDGTYSRQFDRRRAAV